MNVIGAPLKRLEDPRLLAGGGRYVDDVARPGMAHAVIVRSAHAHARLRRVDVRRAAAHPGVLACLTAADFGAAPAIPIRLGAKLAHAAYLQPPLAGDRVRYAGEPVAVVVATDRVGAVDARELVEIEYDVLPAVVDAGDAGRRQSLLLFAEGNVADSWTTSLGDVDAALREAACVVRERFSVGRQTGAPIETRGLAAEWDDDARRLVVWGATKVPYVNRRTLAAMLGLEEAQIDFVESDVGGGFGVRGEFYPEDFLVEELVYDASGQLLTGTFMDYAMPTASGAPPVEIVTHHTPAPSNPLGVKGAGEAGTSGVGAALANAVASALGEGAAPRHLPVTARRVRAAIEAVVKPDVA